MSKVLIVALPKQDIARPPGALAILAACCEQVNVDYEVLDINLYIHKNLPTDIVDQLNTDFELNTFRNNDTKNAYTQVCEQFVTYIQEQEITHIAISVFTYASILATDILLKSLKNSQYTGKVVIGGIGIASSIQAITDNRIFGEYALSEGLVDCAIYGEGELAFVEFLKDNYTYPGINQPNNQQLLDLNILPTPSYNKINPNDYFILGEPEILVTGSRGCVRRCTFCDVASHWNKYVYKSGSKMAEEIFNYWQTTGVSKFDFSDSLINGSVSTFKEFNKELIKYRQEYPDFRPKYKGQFICRPSKLLPESTYAEMSKAGAETLVVGIESFSESVRDHMRKKFDNASIDWHFLMCAKYNIKNVLLLLSGYATETLEDHNTTLEYLRKYQVYGLSRTIYAINIDVGGLKITPDTPLADEELGINLVQYTDSSNSEETQYDNWISMSNLELTPKERFRRSLEVMKVAYELGYKVLHLNQKIDSASRRLDQINSIKKSIVIKSGPLLQI
jgi:radical SAM superfamily enzyme YgiQ (UPF0313 family)